MNAFSVVANTAANASNVSDVQEPNTLVIVIWVAVAVIVVGLWGYVANEAWVNFSKNKTEGNRAELIVAIAAPITLPALAVMALSKWFINRNAMKAA